MRIVLAAWFLIAGVALGLDGPRPRATDGADLYQRLTAGEYVVIATLVKSEGIGEREEVLKKRLREQNTVTTYKVGSLYTLSVDVPLCRQSDFLPAVPSSEDLGKEVYIFIPGGKVLPHDGNHVEMFLPGSRYLLFLKKDPDRDDMIKTYNLNPDRTYHLAVAEDRGAIQLPNDAAKGKDGDAVARFLAAVTSLCQAVQPADVFGKQKGLEMLRLSVDPVVRDNADAAIKALKAAGHIQ